MVTRSEEVAAKRGNQEFKIALGVLSSIENNATTPSVYKLYALCAIYRLDIAEVLEWYGAGASSLFSDAVELPMDRTHLLGVQPSLDASATVPLSLDPGIDMKKTTFLSRKIQRWGKVPLMLLDSFDVKHYRYAFIGEDDWRMFPLIPPGSLLQLDDTRRKIVNSGWDRESERPIYFLETRERYLCGYCTQGPGQLIVQPHPASGTLPEVYKFPPDIEVVGQVIGIAMHLGRVKPQR